MDPARRSFLRGRAAAPPTTARPPWALRPDAAFQAACTRCAACITQCPQQVLHAGDGGFPEIRFDQAGCTLCGACAQACVPRALDPARVLPPFDSTAQLKPGCLQDQGVECRLCADACEARALRFVPLAGGRSRLEILSDRCTGCGSCVALCPPSVLVVGPRRAAP